MKSPSTLLSLLLLLGFVSFQPAAAEDGYDLWLRYEAVAPEWQQRYRSQLTHIVQRTSSPTLQIAHDELARGLAGVLGARVPSAEQIEKAGALLYGTPQSSDTIARLDLPLKDLGNEGYLLRSATLDGRAVTVIAANSDLGVLYGAFHLLRLLQTQQPIDRLEIASTPRLQLRVLNHWDNLDRTVERGYAGQSIWDWHKLPDYLDPRYTDYARANASIGINGTVLTNVNANATSLTPMYLEKVAALANVFRPYGIRVYLTARFSAPIEIGGLQTADPLDPAV